LPTCSARRSGWSAKSPTPSMNGWWRRKPTKRRECWGRATPVARLLMFIGTARFQRAHERARGSRSGRA
jgi:hypothetical protein